MPEKKQEHQPQSQQMEEEQVSEATLAEEHAETEEESIPPEETSPEEALKEEVALLQDRLLRLSAEFDNFRKRSQREKDQIYPDAVAGTVAKFLPILDNFERAISFESQDMEFKRGMEMILDSFREVLGKMDVEGFGDPGDSFCPDLHNAVMHEEDETLGENIIQEVFQRGYKMGDRVIRHAMVKVVN